MRFTNRQILKITFPVLLSLMMEQLIGLTDTIYLGHVGEVELGASAIAGIFYLTIFMVGFGFSIGAQVLIARRNGEGNLAGIGPIFMQGMWFLLGMAVLFFGVSRAWQPWLLGHLIESRAICAAAESYLGYRTFGFFFSFAAAMFRAFYVGTTNTRILTANSVVMVLTNVVLNYLLIFGGWGIPPLGIAGAAIASVISEAVSLVFSSSIPIVVSRGGPTACSGSGESSGRFSGRCSGFRSGSCCRRRSPLSVGSSFSWRSKTWASGRSPLRIWCVAFRRWSSSSSTPSLRRPARWSAT